VLLYTLLWEKLVRYFCPIKAFGGTAVYKIPAKRLGKPEEMAPKTLFLVSPDSAYVAEVELYVNGSVAQVKAQANEENNLPYTMRTVTSKRFLHRPGLFH